MPSIAVDALSWRYQSTVIEMLQRGIDSDLEDTSVASESVLKHNLQNCEFSRTWVFKLMIQVLTAQY